MSQKHSVSASAVAVIALGVSAWIGPAKAADQGLQPRVAHERIAPTTSDCGCCGCWTPEYTRHREIVFNYPDDPRYTLTSEPHYKSGRTYTFVHNWSSVKKADFKLE